MAIINGTNYDHVDLQAVTGGDTTRHMLQDTECRAMIAPTEATSTASAAHAAGSYFIYGGTLYQATADIASGGTITPGTNCVQAVLGNDVSKQSSDFSTVMGSALCPITFQPTLTKGEYISSTTGEKVSSATGARTALWNGYGTRIAVKLDNADYKYRIIYYDATGSVASGDGFLGRSEMASGVQYIPASAAKFALSIFRVDEANLTDEDITAISAALSAYAATDAALTQKGMAADAKVTGNALGLLNEAVRGQPESTTYIGHWTIGGLYSGMAGTTTDTNRARIMGAYLPVIPSGTKVFARIPSGYLARVAAYRSQNYGGALIDIITPGTDFISGDILIPDTYYGKYLGGYLKKTDDSDFTNDEITALASSAALIVDNTYAIGLVENLKTSEKTTLVGAINELHDEAEDEAGYTDQIAGIERLEFLPDSAIKTSTDPVESAPHAATGGWHCAIVNCQPGDQFTIKGTGGTTALLWCFIGADNAQLAHSASSATLNGGVITAPANAEKLAVNISGAGGWAVRGVTPGAQAVKVYRPRVTEFERFTASTNLAWPECASEQQANKEGSNVVQRNCVIALPTSYTPTGKPTPLIMFGHGASSYITDSIWYTTSGNFLSMIRAFTAAGFAVFDVDNTRAQAEGFPDWGCLPLMTLYVNAWEYIKANYNVEHRLYLVSDSMGTAASLNMLKWYPSEIVTSIQIAPRPICKRRYTAYTAYPDEEHPTVFSLSRKRMLCAFGLEPDTILSDDTFTPSAAELDGTVFDARIFKGFQHWENIFEINDEDRLPYQFPPVKVLVGKSDDGFLTEVREYYNALANSGNVVNYREVQGAEHNISFLPNYTGLTEEAVAWLMRFRQ